MIEIGILRYTRFGFADFTAYSGTGYIEIAVFVLRLILVELSQNCSE